MAYYVYRGLSDLAEVGLAVAEAADSSGYTVYEPSAGVFAFSTKNSLVAVTGDQAFFNPVLVVGTTDLELSLAKEATGAGTVGQLDDATTPKIEGLTAPFSLRVLVNQNILALALRDSLGETGVLVAACIDYRELDLPGIEAVPTHFENLQNNGQVVFKPGGSARLLYAGTLSDQTTFDEPALFDTPTLDNSSRLTPQGDTPVFTCLVGKAGAVYGLLSGAMFTNSTAFHQGDKAISQTSEPYRYMRDTSTGEGILLREGG